MIVNEAINGQCWKTSASSKDANQGGDLGVYRLKFTSDIGVETEFGSESSKLSVGLSWEKGIALGAAVNGHGFDVSYRPNGAGLALIGTALVAPEALPEVWRWVTK